MAARTVTSCALTNDGARAPAVRAPKLAANLKWRPARASAADCMVAKPAEPNRSAGLLLNSPRLELCCSGWLASSSSPLCSAPLCAGQVSGRPASQQQYYSTAHHGDYFSLQVAQSKPTSPAPGIRRAQFCGSGTMDGIHFVRGFQIGKQSAGLATAKGGRQDWRGAAADRGRWRRRSTRQLSQTQPSASPSVTCRPDSPSFLRLVVRSSARSLARSHLAGG